MSSPLPEPTPPNPTPEDTSFRTLLVVLLGIAILMVLLLVIYLFNRPTIPQSTAQPAIPIPSTPAPHEIPSPTSTATTTITPTLRPTFTARPSETATVTPTSTSTPRPTLLPSLTPAVPNSEGPPFEMVNWTPELANQLIGLMEAYPETLSAFARGEDDAGYYAAFEYAIFALREALLRFPSAPEAQKWPWQMAYNLARTHDPQAGSAFAALITQELNSGRVQLPDLYAWGLSQTPSMVIEVIPLPVSAGFLSKNLVKVSPEENGSSYFWLLEQTGGFESYPLSSDFAFSKPTRVDYFIEDLLGDGNSVVGTYPVRVPDSQAYQLPRIFSLNQRPPVELFFEPYNPPIIGPEFESHWEPVEPGSQQGDLQFVANLFPACPVTVRHYYEWDGRVFQFREADYEIQPDPDLVAYCEQVVNHSSIAWGVDSTIQLMETLLPLWPPDVTVRGDLYAEDALDEWRYRLAIYHAIAGNQEQAIGFASAIVTNPTTPTSRWLDPAQAFLDAYQEQRDIYTACLPSSFCDPRQAFQSLVETFSTEDYASAPQILANAGVEYLSTGYFDFDKDGQTETWFVLRHQPDSQMEFWILYPKPEGVSALFVNYIESNPPRLTYVEPLGDPPIIQIDPDIAFMVLKHGLDGEPYIQEVVIQPIVSSDLVDQELDRIEEELLSGGDPTRSRDELILVGGSPNFTCSYLLCPRYLYLLGLSNELANLKENAIQTYLELWLDFLGSPYVTMARMKLSGPAIRPGPTITPTRTITPRPTRTGKVPTLTPSSFRTPTPSGTPSTPTPTITGTPPTSTPTPTFTASPTNYPTPP